MPNPPMLEWDMLVEMEVYMNEMLEEHKNEINGLVLIQRQYKKAGKFIDMESIKARIKKLTGFQNKARNFVLFIKDYMRLLKE